MNFAKDIYILSHIKRYSTCHTIRSESVAEHSFFVAAIVMQLHEEYKFNLGQALAMAICHDMPEIELNDVPRVIKARFPNIKEAFEECEQEVINQLPDPIRHALMDYELKDSVEYSIVKLADIIQCLQFTGTEIELGNKGYMQEVHDSSALLSRDYLAYLKPYKRGTDA